MYMPSPASASAHGWRKAAQKRARPPQGLTMRPSTQTGFFSPFRHTQKFGEYGPFTLRTQSWKFSSSLRFCASVSSGLPACAGAAVKTLRIPTASQRVRFRTSHHLLVCPMLTRDPPPGTAISPRRVSILPP